MEAVSLVFAADVVVADGEALVSFVIEEAAAFAMGEALAELEPFAEAELFTVADASAEAEEVDEAAVEADPVAVKEAAAGTVEFEAVVFEEAAPSSETVK